MALTIEITVQSRVVLVEFQVSCSCYNDEQETVCYPPKKVQKNVLNLRKEWIP